MTPAIPLDEAWKRLLALVEPLPVEQVAAEDALGRYLAEQVVARRTQPPADLSAMDGYALAGAGPWRVIGESRCGAPFAGAVAQDEAIRISTGAWMPDGANTVLLQEDSRREVDALTATETPSPGRHIRRAGFDFRAGDVLLSRGTRVGPAQLALALAGGNATLAVRRLPRIAILDSGDELSADPERCGPHQIPASNGAMLAAMARGLPCEVVRIGPVADDPAALATALGRADECDLLVTSGGASVGAHDLVQPALREWGATIDFWRVAIRPGKPLMVARRGRQIALGLPGNPVSSFVTGHLFMLPVVRALLGADDPLPRQEAAVLHGSLPPCGPREAFVRARLEAGVAEPLGEQDSSALAALAASNALIRCPAGSAASHAGAHVTVLRFQYGGNA